MIVVPSLFLVILGLFGCGYVNNAKLRQDENTIEKVFEDATISRPIKKSAEKIEVHTELLPPITPRGDSVKLLKKLIEEMKS